MAHPRHPQVIGAPFPFTAAPGGNRRARPARGRSGSCQDGNKAEAKLSWFSPAATCSLTWEALAKAQPGDLEPLKRDGLGLCRGELRGDLEPLKRDGAGVVQRGAESRLSAFPHPPSPTSCRDHSGNDAGSTWEQPGVHPHSPGLIQTLWRVLGGSNHGEPQRERPQRGSCSPRADGTGR